MGKCSVGMMLMGFDKGCELRHENDKRVVKMGIRLDGEEN
jgi:hypothetical protein